MITGSRSWNDKQAIKDAIIAYKPEIVIHGGASGADSLAEVVCQELGIQTEILLPLHKNKEWYLRRNAEMIGMADYVISFWDGESTGTAFTIVYAKQRKKYISEKMMKQKIYEHQKGK